MRSSYGHNHGPYRSRFENSLSLNGVAQPIILVTAINSNQFTITQNICYRVAVNKILIFVIKLNDHNYSKFCGQIIINKKMLEFVIKQNFFVFSDIFIGDHYFVNNVF